MTKKHNDLGWFLSRRTLTRASKQSFAAMASLAMGLAVLPSTAWAYVVNGSFTGTLDNDVSSDFTSNGFTSAANDAINGHFTFDTANIVASFTATITDLTSDSSFTLPAGAAATASAGVTTTDYTVSSVDNLQFLPTHTPFTATFSLDMMGDDLVAGNLGQTAIFLSGTGSLNLDIPTAPGGPVDQTIGFTLTSAEVPEPASIAMLGFALIGILGIRHVTNGDVWAARSARSGVAADRV